MVLSDKTLKAYGDSLVNPFIPKKVRKGIASYGLSQSGYDIRCAPEFRIITEMSKQRYRDVFNEEPILDPKMGPEKLEILFETFYQDYFDIPAHGFVLTRSIETFTIPPKIVVMCLGKSTYARLGLIANVTPFESMWTGVPTLELSNTSGLPLRVYANEGIAQCLFLEIDQEVEHGYEGKYQNQAAQVVHSRVE